MHSQVETPVTALQGISAAASRVSRIPSGEIVITGLREVSRRQRAAPVHTPKNAVPKYPPRNLRYDNVPGSKATIIAPAVINTPMPIRTSSFAGELSITRVCAVSLSYSRLLKPGNDIAPSTHHRC